MTGIYTSFICRFLFCLFLKIIECGLLELCMRGKRFLLNIVEKHPYNASEKASLFCKTKLTEKNLPMHVLKEISK